MKTKKFTILHSNDIHGDFFAEVAGNSHSQKSQKLIGGLALLSGYINKARAEEENVLFVVAGDMLQGNLIDTEYKGLSTIEIMNYLSPDVVALGNHEFDYGLPHLLFLEKVANFPIVNANLYIKDYNKRLMNPYVILKRSGFDILFTGIITEKIIDALAQDKLIGSFVTLEEAGAEVGKICNAYKNDDIDLTILLTHIGFESDKQLASMLHKDWGVDIIIGGHSHTVMQKPEKINNVLIAQAGTGTNQIGRFDIVVDDATNSIVEYKWCMVDITNQNVEPDQKLLSYISTFKTAVDKKYQVVLCHFSHEHTHPKREIETSLGNLFADAFASVANCDVMFLGSGSVRSKSLGPVVTLQDLMTCFPYNDSLTKFTVTGNQLIHIFSHIMRSENRDGEGECYQVNSGVKAVYSNSSKKLTQLVVQGKTLVRDGTYGEAACDMLKFTICMQGYHYTNSLPYFNISNEDLAVCSKPKVISTSAQEVLQEFFMNNQNIGRMVEGRLIYE